MEEGMHGVIVSSDDWQRGALSTPQQATRDLGIDMYFLSENLSYDVGLGDRLCPKRKKILTLKLPIIWLNLWGREVAKLRV
jgi:hypothetical protein